MAHVLALTRVVAPPVKSTVPSIDFTCSVPRDTSLQRIRSSYCFRIGAMGPRELPSGPVSDQHDTVDRTSTPAILVAVAIAALLVYELQLVLVPFLISGLVAYICSRW